VVGWGGGEGGRGGGGGGGGGNNKLHLERWVVRISWEYRRRLGLILRDTSLLQLLVEIMAVV